MASEVWLSKKKHQQAVGDSRRSGWRRLSLPRERQEVCADSRAVLLPTQSWAIDGASSLLVVNGAGSRVLVSPRL